MNYDLCFLYQVLIRLWFSEGLEFLRCCWATIVHADLFIESTKLIYLVSSEKLIIKLGHFKRVEAIRKRSNFILGFGEFRFSTGWRFNPFLSKLWIVSNVYETIRKSVDICSSHGTPIDHPADDDQVRCCSLFNRQWHWPCEKFSTQGHLIR